MFRTCGNRLLFFFTTTSCVLKMELVMSDDCHHHQASNTLCASQLVALLCQMGFSVLLPLTVCRFSHSTVQQTF